MARKNERIPTNAAAFAAYMQNTDELQLSAGNLGTTQKWQNWGWTAAQSAQWTTFRNECNALYPQYADATHKSASITARMNFLIKATKKYDNDTLTGFHLLDKVGLFGSIDDCETFHVKRSSPLAKVSRQGSPNVQGLVANEPIPLLAVTGYEVREHAIRISNPETPKSHALPQGVKFAKVYRYVGTSAPGTSNAYVFVGNAKNGILLSSFTDADFAGFAANATLYAWYLARYENNKGMLGDACGAIRAQVVRA